MSHPAARRHLLGLGLDGKGTGPDSEDGATRITRGEDYHLVGGDEALHGRMQEVAEAITRACRDEGTSLGEASPGLIREILSDLSDGSAGPPAR